MDFLRNTQDLLYQKKIKCISSPEQNYFAHFAMRYPVELQLEEQSASLFSPKNSFQFQPADL